MDPEGKQEGAQVPKGPSRLKFAVLFAFMTTVGIVVGFFSTVIVTSDSYFLSTIQGGILIGASLGLAQWIVVRDHIRRILEASGSHSTQVGCRILRESVWWALATSGGMLLCVSIILTMRLAARKDEGFIIAILILSPASGALISLFVWLLLRRTFPRAGKWIWHTLAGSIVGFLLFYFVVIPAGLFAPGSPYIGLFCIGASLGIPLGTFQAICLYRMEPAWRKRLLEIVRDAPTSTE